jgi:methyl-accepting chemotaxis protein
MKLESLATLKLGQMATLVIFIFLIPLVLMTWLFFSQALSILKFSTQELGGTRYISAVWPIYVDVIRQEGSVAALDERKLANLKSLATLHDATFGTSAASGSLITALERGKPVHQAAEISIKTIADVTNGSGLAIDPDLDSVYLMDVAMFDLPGMLHNAHEAADILLESLGRKAMPADMRTEVILAIGELVKAAEGVPDGYASAIRANKDKGTATAIAAPLAKYEIALKAFLEKVQTVSKQTSLLETTTSDVPEIVEKFNALVSDTDTLWQVTTGEIARLIDKRVATQKWIVFSRLGFVAAALLIAAILSYVLIQTLRNQLADAINHLGKLRNRETDFTISDLGVKNELGDLARGLEQFRTTIVDLDEATTQREGLKAAEIHRAAEIAELAAVINEVVGAAKQGDFTRRISSVATAGVMHDLADGVNELTITVDRGLSEAVRVVAALARGDTSQRITGEFTGSFLLLKHDTNTMAEKFRDIGMRISGVSREVHSATREISFGVTDLASRTEHQASSLEETSASMEELSATVAQNASSAEEANQLAAAASSAATNGGAIALQAVAAMSRIEDSSRQIGDIVGLIQDIAFQTNILALNAAVEAARAGEAGKGFAVVANEVRALSQRASQASKDIKSLIVNSDTHVNEGVTLVKQAGTSLGEIVISVRKVARLVAEIAAATQEQSTGIHQVSKAVSSMDQMTQQNAALVEETNAAIHSAQSQIDALREAVSFFKSDGVIDAANPVPAAGQVPGQLSSHNQLHALAQRMSSARSAI